MICLLRQNDLPYRHTSPLQTLLKIQFPKSNEHGELVEFKRKLVEVQDFMKFTNNFRGIYRIYPTPSIKKKPKDVNM